MNYYVAVNGYRTSTSNGFANTWVIYKCRSRKQQKGVLENGLPVSDSWFQDDERQRSPVFSTMGVRSLCADEYREIRSRSNQDPRDIEPISWVEDLFPVVSPVDEQIEIEPFRN